MAGTAASGRPGGNPELEKFQFTPKGEESLTEKITFRVTPSTNEFLRSLDKPLDFIREAIAEKMARHKAATTEATRTETTEQQQGQAGQQPPQNQTTQAAQATETNPNQEEQPSPPGKQRKASRNPTRSQAKPRNQSQTH